MWLRLPVRITHRSLALALLAGLPCALSSLPVYAEGAGIGDNLMLRTALNVTF